MGTIYTGTGKSLQEVRPVSIDVDGLREMQRRVITQPHFFGEPLVIIGESEDFAQAAVEGSYDMLALDVNGNCVLIHLSTGISDATSDIQILQVASYVASLHAEDLGKIAHNFIYRQQNDKLRRQWEDMGVEISEEAVELASLLAVTFERDAEDYATMINSEQRIIIAAEGFTSRLVKTIEWLYTSGVSIVGLRYRTFLVGGQEVYFAEQVVPMSDPAVDATEQTRQSPESLEPWRTKGRLYHVERMSPNIAKVMDNITVMCRPSTFSINWSNKYYFWVRGSKRNLRIRTYHRNQLDIGFNNSSIEATREFLASHGLDNIEVAIVGGYTDSPFVTITADMTLDNRWETMLNDWLGGKIEGK